MTGSRARTPAEQRADRRAGIGCATVVLLAGIAFVVGGFVLLSDEGTLTNARILSCDPRPPRTPARCRGMWVDEGRFVQGPVDGASQGDVGRRIEVRASGGSASATHGRDRSAVALFALAAFFLIAGGAIAVSIRRARHAAA